LSKLGGDIPESIQNTTVAAVAFHIRNNNKSVCENVFNLNGTMPIAGKTLQTSYILATNKTVKQ